MIALLGSLIGFISALAPDIFKLLTDRRDKAHELAVLQLQMQVQAQGHSERMEEISANADIGESAALYKTYTTGIEWVDALNGTVRPVLAYAFFLLYSASKAYLCYSFEPNPDMPWITLAQVIWTAEDTAIFSGIVSFYFGTRALSRARQGK